MTEILKTPASSSNLYDLFIEAVEDASYPLSDDTFEDDQHYVDSNLRYKKTGKSNNDFYSKLFFAFQKVNMPLSESSDSLSSSISNSSSQQDLINGRDIYHALTKFNGLPTDSTNSLSSLDSTPRFTTTATTTTTDDQTVLTQFFKALESFLQKENNDSSEPFPKFC